MEGGGNDSFCSDRSAPAPPPAVAAGGSLNRIRTDASRACPRFLPHIQLDLAHPDLLPPPTRMPLRSSPPHAAPMPLVLALSASSSVAAGTHATRGFHDECSTEPAKCNEQRPQIGWSVSHTGQGTHPSKGKRVMDHAFANHCDAALPLFAAGIDVPARSSNAVSIPITACCVSLPSIRVAPPKEKSRRKKICEGLKALKESAPSPRKGTKESSLDDVIDYIKFLKLQVKVLSQTRLGGEPTSNDLLYLEGFGHYLAHQQLGSDPLEEIVEQLMDASMPAMIQFLEHKGLAILPMALAGDLVESD